MQGKKRPEPSVTTMTDIAGSKEIQGLFLNMIANQLARKTQQKAKSAQKTMNTTKPYQLAAKFVGNFLFENGMTKSLQTASNETGGLIKTIGLPSPITADFKFKSERPFFRQLVSKLRPNLDRPRPLPPSNAPTEVSSVAPAAAKPAARYTKRRREEPEESEISKHHHHHHHRRRDEHAERKTRHHRGAATETTETYETRHRTHHRHHEERRRHRKPESTYDASYVSTSTYGAVKARDIPKTKPVNQRPKVPGRMTFKERVARLLMKSNLAVEKSLDFEYLGDPNANVPAYYPSQMQEQRVFQPPTAKSATSRTGLPSDQYYEEEDEEEDAYTYGSTKKTTKTGTLAKTQSTTAKTPSTTAKTPSTTAKTPSTMAKSSTKKETETGESSSDKDTEGDDVSDPEAEEDEEEEEDKNDKKKKKKKGEEEEEEEEEEEDKGEEDAGEGEEE